MSNLIHKQHTYSYPTLNDKGDLIQINVHCKHCGKTTHKSVASWPKAMKMKYLTLFRASKIDTDIGHR
jgi:hypothetical protein